jgi:hypothetical protein
VNRTAVVLFAGDARREEAQKGLPARFLAKLHERLMRTIRAFDVDLLIADELVAGASTLNEKIERAFESGLTLGYTRVIALAGDIVLEPSILRRAIESSDTLIGPTRDGGFYILACNEAPSIDWSSLAFADVAAQLNHATLPELRDVDSIDDARVVAPSLIPCIVPKRERAIRIVHAVTCTQLRAPPSFV